MGEQVSPAFGRRRQRSDPEDRENGGNASTLSAGTLFCEGLTECSPGPRLSAVGRLCLWIGRLAILSRLGKELVLAVL
jgi:hypothetical protein